MKVEVERLDKGLPLPEYVHPGEDAGIDLYSRENVYLPYQDWALIKTGIKVAIPKGYGGFINPRSGMALKHGITVLNADGVIDPGYRGEVGIILINHSIHEDFEIFPGDRIAQLIVMPTPRIEWKEVESLDKTKRNDGGFGHSGR